MHHEKTLKRPDGSRIRIAVGLYVSSSDQGVNISVYLSPPGKRTFTDVHNRDDYSWRRLGSKDRAIAVLQTQLQFVSLDEINTVINELIENLKQKIIITL